MQCCFCLCSQSVCNLYVRWYECSMCVRMYACMRVKTYMHTHIHTYTCMHVRVDVHHTRQVCGYTYIHIYIYIHIYTYIYIYIHIYTYIYIYIHIYTYIHIYIYIYIHIYMYTYIYIHIPCMCVFVCLLSGAAERYPHCKAVVTGSHPGYSEPCALHTSRKACFTQYDDAPPTGGSSSAAPATDGPYMQLSIV